MKNRVEKWVHAQTKAIFGGIKTPRRGKRAYTFLIALPFFFIAILTVGLVVADAGAALSEKAVAFIHAKEKKPEVVTETRRAVAKAGGKKRSWVASKTN